MAISAKDFPLKVAKPYIEELTGEIKDTIKNLDIDLFIKTKGFPDKIRIKSENPKKKWNPKFKYAFKNMDVIRDILEICFSDPEYLAKESLYHDEDETFLVHIQTGWNHGSQIYSPRADAVYETRLYSVKCRQLAYGDRDEFGFPFDIYEIVPRIGEGNHPIASMEDWWCMP